MNTKYYVLGSAMILYVLYSSTSALIIDTTVTWNVRTGIHNQEGGFVEVVDGGHLIANNRVDMNGFAGGTCKLIMNGGLFESKDDFKHPDNNTGFPCVVEINAGTFIANQIQIAWFFA